MVTDSLSLFRYGLEFSTGFTAEPSPSAFELREGISAAESLGIDALFVRESAAAVVDGATLLGALAVLSSRARLGLVASLAGGQNPAMLAKSASSIDVISHGRAILGIAASSDSGEGAWRSVNASADLDQLEEALSVGRAMFADESPTFSGRFYEIDGARNLPRPVSGRVPFLLEVEDARQLDLVARYADVCLFDLDVEELPAQLSHLQDCCRSAVRDISTITTAVRLALAAPLSEILKQAGTALDAGINAVVLSVNLRELDSALSLAREVFSHLS